MSREWQQTKLSEYVMPNAVYYQSIWAVRDLERMEDRLEELKFEGKITGTSVVKDFQKQYDRARVNKVEDVAMEVAILQERIEGITNALNQVPERYRKSIMDNIFQKDVSTNSKNKLWRAWKQKFLFQVAKNLSLM